MPLNYKPTNWELLLTQHLTLPPPFLPAVQPLLGLLSSLTLYVGLGVLLPKWFASSYQTLLKYQQVQSKNHLDPLDQENGKPDNSALLVKLSREMRVYAGNKGLVVCPLQQTTT